MVFFQLDPTRIIQVYVLQGIIAAFFLYLAYKILKRDTKRLNLMFSLGFISSAVGLLLNFIYAPLTDETVVIVLYYITIFVIYLFGAFFVVFVLMLLKSEKVITPKKQAIYVIIYFVAELCSVFIPDGVTINASTDWKPVWSVALFIYFVSVIVILGMLPSLYYSVQIYKRFEDELIKKKWKYFIYGIIGIYAFAVGTLFSNTLNVQLFRTIWSGISLVLVIASPLLLYYGVGRQIEK